MGKYHDDYPKGRPAWAGLINAIFQQLDQQMTDMDDGTHAFESINVDGGTFDDVTIGANSPAPATFTTASVSGDLDFGSCLQCYLSYTQGISAAATDKIQFDYVVADTHDDYDIDNFRFTPSRAGLYQFTINVDTTASAGAKEFKIMLYKNGSVVSTQQRISVGTVLEVLPLEPLVYANGSTDYFEVFLYNGDSGTINIGTNHAPSFSALRIF